MINAVPVIQYGRYMYVKMGTISGFTTSWDKIDLSTLKVRKKTCLHRALCIILWMNRLN